MKIANGYAGNVAASVKEQTAHEKKVALHQAEQKKREKTYVKVVVGKTTLLCEQENATPEKVKDYLKGAGRYQEGMQVVINRKRISI